MESLRALLASTDYEPISLIARGGIANVFRVEHRFLGRPYALKLLHPSVLKTPGLVERLLLEAKILGRLESPHIVEVIDLWVNLEGIPLLFLEYLEGETVASLLDGGRQVPPHDAVHWTLELLSALEAAHGEGLIHRDLKPANLFLHRLPRHESIPGLLTPRPQLKVLDFGLARVFAEFSPANESTPVVRTTTGALVGSPSYMSPEGLRGERVDERADLFAVGLLLYEMLVGRGPFERSETMTPASHIRRDLDPRLDSVLEQALQPSPSARFQTAPEFSKALRATLFRDSSLA
jgi:serine/threonine-protein kinase